MKAVDAKQRLLELKMLGESTGQKELVEAANIGLQILGNHATSKELAERWHASTGHLGNLRSQGKGPRWIQPGKLALYPMEEILDYEDQIKKGNPNQ